MLHDSQNVGLTDRVGTEGYIPHHKPQDATQDAHWHMVMMCE